MKCWRKRAIGEKVRMVGGGVDRFGRTFEIIVKTLACALSEMGSIWKMLCREET